MSHDRDALRHFLRVLKDAQDDIPPWRTFYTLGAAALKARAAIIACITDAIERERLP